MIHQHIPGEQSSWSHRCKFQNFKPHMYSVIIVRNKDPENDNCQPLKSTEWSESQIEGQMPTPFVV
jgi:hypothetical protein